MFHSIITILTMSAVTLHALLGCCAHHSHACDEQQHEVAVVETAVHDEHCHHQHDDQVPADDSAANHCGHQRHSDHQHPDGDGQCSEPDCSFVTSEHIHDVTLVMMMWLPVAGDADHLAALKGSLGRQAGADVPIDSLRLPDRLRANMQVWLL